MSRGIWPTDGAMFSKGGGGDKAGPVPQFLLESEK